MNNLLDDIYKDLALRKQELTNIYLNCEESEVSRRCYLVMAAAHWEGFLRSTINAIYNEIEKNAIINNNLNSIYNTLALEEIFESKDSFIRKHEKIKNLPNEKFNLKKVESRPLKFETFKFFLYLLEADAKRYDLRKNWIDHTLLKSRHKIAHGEIYKPEYADVTEVHEYLINILFSLFLNDIESYVKNAKYLTS